LTEVVVAALQLPRTKLSLLGQEKLILEPQFLVFFDIIYLKTSLCPVTKRYALIVKFAAVSKT
jgi:hypothetical protein